MRREGQGRRDKGRGTRDKGGGAVALLLVGLLLAAGMLRGAVAPADQAIRREIAQVERSVDRRFRGVEASPMAMLGATRGAYLKGYGAVFTLEVNLVPMANLSPFRRSYSEEEKRKLNVRKRQRLETLEAKAHEILVEESARLVSLPAGEKIALAISLFHFAWEDLTRLPSQLVMAAAKDALDQARAGSLTAAERKRKIEVRYF